MKPIYCLMIMLCPIVAMANGKHDPIPVEVGQEVPALQIRNVKNAPTSTINLKDFKGKTLIIQFLLTTCPSCLATTKKYDALIKASGGTLKVLLVTSENEDRVRKFNLKHPGYFGNLPFVVNDTALKQLFPYEYVSHIVWINPEGKVAAITFPEYILAKNISVVNDGVIPKWTQKRDVITYDKHHPLLKENEDNIPSTSMATTMGYSAFFSNMLNMPVSVHEETDTATNSFRAVFINHPIPLLYMRILGLSLFPATHIILNVPDPDYYYWDGDKYYYSGWNQYNTYNYECVLPANLPKALLQKKMLADLDFNLGTNAHLVDTIVESYILDHKGTATLPFSDTLINDGQWIAVRNIIAHLNERFTAMPAISNVPELDEKYIRVTMDLLKDMSALQRQLSLYGLTFNVRPSKIQALVIRQDYTFRFTHSSKLYSK